MNDNAQKRKSSEVTVQYNDIPTVHPTERTGSKGTLEERDRLALARLGKKQALKRNFGFMSMLAFSCAVLVTWEGVFTSFPNFFNGGKAGVFYGFMVIWCGTFSTFVSIAELASIAPTAGGQYHWVAMLAPRSCHKFMSYLTGWMTLVAWQAAIASGAFLSGSIISGLLIQNYPSYQGERWQVTLLIWASNLVAVIINTIGSMLLPFIEGGLLFIHIAGWMVIFIVLCYMAPRGSAAQVFTEFHNGGGWQTQGLSFMVGLIGLAFAFVGADAAVHMSEEIQNASVNVPRSIIWSVAINGSLGVSVLLAALFGIPDILAVLDSPTGWPFIEIFSNVTGGNVGGNGLSSIILIMMFACTIGFVATSSRMIWAFARDKGLPFSTFLSKVHPRTSIPLNSVTVTTVIAVLIGLINLGSTVVLNNVFSLSLVGFYSTYFASVALLLWRRLRGDIKEPYEVEEHSIIRDVHSTPIAWGPWRVKGWLGVAINVFACCYLIVIISFSIWPPYLDPTPDQMNYSVVGIGIVLVWSVGYYLIFNKGRYQGPVVEILT